MKLIKQIALLLTIAICTVLSCKKKDYSLSALPDKSQINMEVKQDLTVDPGGNTVYLINHTDNVEPIWDYVTGKSIRRVDTVRYAFKGDYIIRRSAVTQAGIVNLDSIVIHVTDDNLNYVSDPLWILLTGGPGNEKTWVLDADAAGNKKVFTSPIYFVGQDAANPTKAADGKSVAFKGKESCADQSSPDCWVYGPDYVNDTWAADKMDYGFMTFSLKGGPFLKTDHKGVAGVGTESGTYYFDVNTLTLTTNNATILAMKYTPGDVANLYSARVLSLTENTMQLAVKHKSKSEYQMLNYISKQYNDNWVPPPPSTPKPDDGFNPVFAPGEILNMLTGGASSPGRYWTIDVNGNPVDWVKKGNGFTTDKNSSYNWGWNETWDDAVKDAAIRFDYNGKKYTRIQNGTITTGTFTIDETKNEVVLVGNTLLQNPASWMNPAATTLKIVKGWPTDYKTKGIWFGTNYDVAKDEWLVFHYITP
ncbi:MAG TPA: hypothetical protein VJU78_01810 [Chitinophagaceae bacterium]|nr:hypothetical protein [Chitinophagaceae bacterium]